MGRRNTTHYLTLALAPWLLLSACDSLASTSYRGESRLQLRIGVVKSQSDSAETVVPALASVEDSRVLFRPVDHRDTLSGEFRVNVFDAPAPERLVPFDRFRAANVTVAREYISAVLPARVDQPILLTEKVIPIYPDCWNEACDVLPGAMSMACDDDDQECLDRQRQCPSGMCQVVESQRVLPDGIEDVIGFSDEYLLLYAVDAIPAGSWAATKLGAPEGLDSGYHLIKILSPSQEAHDEAFTCLYDAATAVLEQFDAKHGTMHDPLIVACGSPLLRAFPCDVTDLSESEHEELAAALTAEELSRGCLALAPEMKLVRRPAEELIAVRINGDAPGWFPPVPPTGMGVEPADCPFETTADGERLPPDLAVRLKGYSGSLCPEDSLLFSEDDNSFGLLGFGSFTGGGTCEATFSLTVPAGYRFRRPICSLVADTTSESERTRPTFVTMTYAMASDPMSSHHVVYPSVTEASFSLTDTPAITVPECSEMCESQELELTIALDFDAPETTSTWFLNFSCVDRVGVEWTPCTTDFPER